MAEGALGEEALREEALSDDLVACRSRDAFGMSFTMQDEGRRNEWMSFNSIKTVKSLRSRDCGAWSGRLNVHECCMLFLK